MITLTMMNAYVQKSIERTITYFFVHNKILKRRYYINFNNHYISIIIALIHHSKKCHLINTINTIITIFKGGFNESY